MLKHDLHAWGVTFSIIFVVIDTCYHFSTKKLRAINQAKFSVDWNCKHNIADPKNAMHE